jgi:hypothetical protein
LLTEAAASSNWCTTADALRTFFMDSNEIVTIPSFDLDGVGSQSSTLAE